MGPTKPEREAGAALRFAVRRDLPVVPRHDALRDRQTDTDPFEV
jgi:hypothetical protein